MSRTHFSNLHHKLIRRLSRRDLMMYGAATVSTTALLAALGSRQRLAASGGSLEPSPKLTPFIEQLPVPVIARPITPSSFLPDPPRALPADIRLYELTARQALHSFHRNLPLNSIWGYDGVLPGPTILAEGGSEYLVRYNNRLPANDPVGIGLPINSIHRHGGFQEPESDGYPGEFFLTGGSRDYLFPNPVEDSNLWYHDHSLDITAENVYRGLSGVYLIFNKTDSLAGELDPDPNALRLPGRMVDGVRKYDVPLIFQDRQFDRRGFLVYDSFNHNGFVGDTFLVNGKVQPYMDVEPRKYRFRFLNGSNARQYEFVLRDGNANRPFDYVIGTDSRLLEAPIADVESFRISSAERVQVVIDFAKYAGKTITVVNRLEQKEGRKPEGVVSPGTAILQFRVAAGRVADPSRVPPVLQPIPFDERPENVLKRGVQTRREFKWGRQGGAWAVNGQLYDENRIDAKPVLDEYEIWDLESGGGWEHPVHIHLSNFFIIDREGKRPPPLERSWKDAVVVGGKRGDARVLIKFSGYTGRYVFHCHTTEHEDARMMANFEVQPKSV